MIVTLSEPARASEGNRIRLTARHDGTLVMRRGSCRIYDLESGNLQTCIDRRRSENRQFAIYLSNRNRRRFPWIASRLRIPGSPQIDNDYRFQIPDFRFRIQMAHMNIPRRIFLFGVAALIAVMWLAPDMTAQQTTGGRGGRGGREVIRPVDGKCPANTALVGPDECSRIVPPVNGECPAGTTLQRPGSCMFPEFSAPSILDYRPRSTLVVDEHMVPRAKYPVIDIHSHLGVSELNIEQTIKEMDALNLQVLVNLSGGTQPDQIKGRVDFIKGTKYGNRLFVFANVNWDRPDAPGWAAKAVADLEAAVRNGAIGLKVAKSLGLQSQMSDGSLVKVNSPLLKPIWELCARLNIPVIIHTAEPEEFFSPLDLKNERWLELALFEDR